MVMSGDDENRITAPYENNKSELNNQAMIASSPRSKTKQPRDNNNDHYDEDQLLDASSITVTDILSLLFWSSSREPAPQSSSLSTGSSTVTSDKTKVITMTMNEKEEIILDCLAGGGRRMKISTTAGHNDSHHDYNDDVVDLWYLRELALSEGGLLNPSIRKRAWIKLVPCHPAAAASSSSSLQFVEPLTEDLFASKRDLRTIPWDFKRRGSRQGAARRSGGVRSPKPPSYPPPSSSSSSASPSSVFREQEQHHGHDDNKNKDHCYGGNNEDTNDDSTTNDESTGNDTLTETSLTTDLDDTVSDSNDNNNNIIINHNMSMGSSINQTNNTNNKENSSIVSTAEQESGSNAGGRVMTVSFAEDHEFIGGNSGASPIKQHRSKATKSSMSKQDQRIVYNVVKAILQTQPTATTGYHDDNEDQQYRYFSGMNEIAALCMINLESPSLSTLFLRQLATSHLRDALCGGGEDTDDENEDGDAMSSSWSSSSRRCRLRRPLVIQLVVHNIFPLLLERFDPNLHAHLFSTVDGNRQVDRSIHKSEDEDDLSDENIMTRKTTTMLMMDTIAPIVAEWVATWYSRDCDGNVMAASRLFDVFVVSHPIAPLYMAVALFAWDRRSFLNIALSYDEDDDDDDDDEDEDDPRRRSPTRQPKWWPSSSSPSSSSSSSSVMHDLVMNLPTKCFGKTTTMSIMNKKKKKHSSGIGDEHEAATTIKSMADVEYVIAKTISYMNELPPSVLIKLVEQEEEGEEDTVPKLNELKMTMTRGGPSWNTEATVPTDLALLAKGPQKSNIETLDESNGRHNTKEQEQTDSSSSSNDEESDDDEDVFEQAHSEERPVPTSLVEYPLAAAAAGFGNQVHQNSSHIVLVTSGTEQQKHQRSVLREKKTRSWMNVILLVAACVAIALSFRFALSENWQKRLSPLMADTVGKNVEPSSPVITSKRPPKVISVIRDALSRNDAEKQPLGRKLPDGDVARLGIAGSSNPKPTYQDPTTKNTIVLDTAPVMSRVFDNKKTDGVVVETSINTGSDADNPDSAVPSKSTVTWSQKIQTQKPVDKKKQDVDVIDSSSSSSLDVAAALESENDPQKRKPRWLKRTWDRIRRRGRETGRIMENDNVDSARTTSKTNSLLVTKGNEKKKRFSWLKKAWKGVRQRGGRRDRTKPTTMEQTH